MQDENYEILPEEEVSDKKKGKQKRTRNLVQYRHLSDEDFEKVMEKKNIGGGSKDFEERINQKLKEFEQDYDLSDLKINDRDSLRSLIQKQLTLEDYEQYLFALRSNGIAEAQLQTFEKFQKAMESLTSDISKIQNDLMITRRVRKSDQDASVMAYIDGLKEKAKRFYESKMSYIFCEKCNMLLATMWTLYPEEERNKLALVCHRKLADGSECGHKTIVDTKTLLEKRGTNKAEITPDSMR